MAFDYALKDKDSLKVADEKKEKQLGSILNVKAVYPDWLTYRCRVRKQ